MVKVDVIRSYATIDSELPQRIEPLVSEREALTFLLPLSHDYPGIEKWFASKVLPGIRQGTRRIIKIERSGSIAAIGIAKKEICEHKICTVRVAGAYVGKGLGLHLFDELLTWLGMDQPHLTVSELKLPAFRRIFDYYGFRMTSTELGRYLPDQIEYSYNEAALLKLLAQREVLSSLGTSRSNTSSDSVLPISNGKDSVSA